MSSVLRSEDLSARLQLIRNGSVTARASVERVLSSISARNKELNAFHEVFGDEALTRADSIDQSLASGDDPGPLAGATIAIKDNICTRLGKTTCSSRMLEEYSSPFDATVVERIEAAGGIVLGKTNLDEFAMGSSSEHCAWGPVRNPADPTRVPGGSSGGSAAAVAADLADAALGSDTGGSIRQPAAFCGCVGFKPTYGRVSRWGLVAFGSSLDQIGPLTQSVRDAALLYSILAGEDPRDSTSAAAPLGNPLGALDQPIEGLRIGVVKEHRNDENDPAVNGALDRTIELFRGAGATIVDIELPLAHFGLSTYYVIAPAEASSNLARYDGIRYGYRADHRPGDTLEDMYARTRATGFGTEVKRRIMLGTYLLSAGYYDAYYVHALKARRLIKQEYDSAFERCDVLLGPTTPTPAFEIGQTNDPLAMYLNDIYTVNANIAGICAISIPAGMVEVDGTELPIGLQLQAQAFDEDSLFRAASAAESLLK